MSKINQEVFDFFSSRDTLKKTERLIETFDEFKQELFSKFWEQLYVYMEKNLKVTNWEVKYEILRIDEDTSSINIVQLMTKRI